MNNTHESKRTKIVATLGPGSEDKELLRKMILAGMNVARFNMSHGDHAEHKGRIDTIKVLSQELGIPVAILVDLSGPKIRTGEYTTERITIHEGDSLILTTEQIVGTTERISVNYPALPSEVEKGTIIKLDDGKKALQVEKIDGTEITCSVLIGGELKPRRGVNVPGAELSIKSITEKDKKDLAFALENGAHFVAFSFVRSAEDAHELRELITAAGGTQSIIAKIETQQAIDRFDEILDEVDGIMVARGDLAIEVPTEMVPVYQKDMIAKSNHAGKPVITATQMLESMIDAPVPTRAEVSDIANAIYDGTDAVMLSEESSLGSYPVEAIEVMSRISETVESDNEDLIPVPNAIQDSISASVCRIAEDVHARHIVAFTEKGTTARLVSRFKPHCPIIALSPNDETITRLALTHGVHPYKMGQQESMQETAQSVREFLLERKLSEEGDIVVLTAGLTVGISGSTNTLFAMKV